MVPSIAMGFALQLAQDLIEVEAGGNSPVTILVTNSGATADRYELDIEGLDLDWKAIPVPVFSAEPGEVRSERAFFKPPRASESGSGNYPFVVSVRSLESGEQKSVQGVLRVKPYHSLTLEISPKKGLHSWATHRNTFEISLANLGNTEHTLQLVGSDPEDACTYEFEQERITIGPGQQKDVSVEVRPSSSPLLAGSKLIGFSIHARSVDVPSVVASGQAQLERRSLLSPANLTVLILLLLLGTAWYLMKPKQPGIDLLINPMEGVAGDKVTVSWAAHDADHVKITAVDATNERTVLYDDSALDSNLQVTLSKTPGTESFFAEVSRGQNRGPSVTKTVKVDAPEPAVVPKILSFSTDKDSSSQDSSKGDSETIRGKVPFDVVFTWQVEGAEGVGLTPDFPHLEPGLGSQAVEFNSAADKVYQLVVWSKDKKYVYSKSIRVIASEVSDANVVSFTAFPLKVESGGVVTISWNVVNASLISLKHDGATDSPLAPTDSKSYPLTHDTTFVLEALDSKNRASTRKIVVKVQPIDVPPPGTTSGPADGTTTGVSPTTTPIPPGTTVPPITPPATAGNPK